MEENDELSQLEKLLNTELFENNRKDDETKPISEIDIFKSEGTLAPENDVIQNETSFVHNGDTDSSDDEERRNYTERKYNNYGSQVKKALDHTEEEQLNKKIEFETRLRQTNIDMKVEKSNTFKKKLDVSSEQSNKNQFCAPAIKSQQSDVFTDPIFGIRITKPLISSSALLDRMQGREAVNMLRVKRYVENEDLSKDWVLAGVIVRKNISKNQKGNQFAIWTLSDLMHDLKTISMFLFRKAYNDLWKLSEGTVVAILNPNVLDRSENSKDVACLSVESPDRVMNLGQSKDLGVCKSRKKNGEPCKSFINLSQGEHCIYHVKVDYQKYAKRQELQSSTMGKGLVNLQNKVLGKNTVIYGGKTYSALPSGNNKKVKERDQNRLMLLSDYNKSENDSLMINKAPYGAGPMNKKCNILHSPRIERTTDNDRLNQLNLSPQNNIRMQHSSLAARVANSPKLGKGFGLKGSGTIDLSVSYGQRAAEKAKVNAVKFIQQNGGIEKIDPNNIKGTQAGKKRAIEKLNSECDENAVKKIKVNIVEAKTPKAVMSERFKKIMEATSAHHSLIEQHDNNEQEKYFDKLEKKEAMEERMLNTFKLACKAVRCTKCKYTAFSAAQRCKDEKHPLKVLDTTKRFFKCGNCSNRTISLEIIPLHACSSCGGSNWQKAPMLREKKVTSLAAGLSIRGEEEVFIGGQINAGKNIDLLVPDS